MAYSKYPNQNRETLTRAEKLSLLYFCWTNLCSYSEHRVELEDLFILQSDSEKSQQNLTRRKQFRAYRRRGHAALIVALTVLTSSLTLIQFVAN